MWPMVAAGYGALAGFFEPLMLVLLALASGEKPDEYADEADVVYRRTLLVDQNRISVKVHAAACCPCCPRPLFFFFLFLPFFSFFFLLRD
jgi:hypothetical protein